MPTTASFFLPITKVDTTPEGHRLVTGTVSTERVDLDGQIADYEWAKKEAQGWFEIGNVREQHSRSAAGKALDLQLDDANKTISVTAKIIDPIAIAKVDEKVYTGFSFGAKNVPGNPVRVIKDAQAPGGRIVGGKWIEISLADRPANPDAVITLVKAAGGSFEIADAIGQVGEPEPGKVADLVEEKPEGEKVVQPDATKDGTAVGVTDTYGGGTGSVDVSIDGSIQGAAGGGDSAANGAGEHMPSLTSARKAIRQLIVEEASESDPKDNDFQPLVDALNALNCFETVESFEYQYAAMVTQMAQLSDKEQRRGLYKDVAAALTKAADEHKATIASADATKSVEADVTPAAAPPAETPTQSAAPSAIEKVVNPDTETTLTADAIKAVLPDQLKAMMPELLKEHAQVLKEALADTFAGKELEKTVETLGKRAQPGGPVMNADAAGLRAIEKSHPVNAVVEPGDVPLDALQEMAKYAELSKVEDIPTAHSARRMLTKLQNQYGVVPASS
jgi:hypothetical protein